MFWCFLFKLTYVLLDIAIVELFPELNKVRLFLTFFYYRYTTLLTVSYIVVAIYEKMSSILFVQNLVFAVVEKKKAIGQDIVIADFRFFFHQNLVLC